MSKQVGMSVDVANKKVFIQFDRDLSHVELSTQQAMELIDAIYSKVKLIDGSDIILLPSGMTS